MKRSLLTTLRLIAVAALIGAPVAYAFHHNAQRRNFRTVRAGVLYRSAQTTPAGLKRLLHDYGIRTVISLRDSYTGGTPPDAKEEEYCRKMDVLYVRIPPRAWEAAGESPPVEKGVRRFLEVMADPANHPVLVHCCAGIHRTGAYCAVYRMEFEGWSNAQAIAELKALGYANFDVEWDIRRYLENYRPGHLVKVPSQPATSR